MVLVDLYLIPGHQYSSIRRTEPKEVMMPARKRFVVCTKFVVLAMILLTACGCATEREQGKLRTAQNTHDYSWVRGANYVPTYAGTDVGIWHRFDPEVIDRELGYAEQIGLNSVRVFLQYHVYECHRDAFLRNVSTFVELCEKHGIRPMLVVFDSCFGVSPSLQTTEFWVASPGPDRTNPAFYPDGERYVKDLIELFRDDPRVLFWDVMNEPMSTWLAGSPEGVEQILDFVTHFCDYFHELGVSQPITVGDVGQYNVRIVDFVDVISIHTYNKTAEGLREDIMRARRMASKAAKPFVISECCAPAWECHYEMAMPLLREQKVGYYFWELMIGKTVFRSVAGLFYPDGTVRRISELEAVMDRPAIGFEEKPDSEGVSYSAGADFQEILTRTLARMADTPTDDENYRERYTLFITLTRTGRSFGGASQEITRRVDIVGRLLEQGEKRQALHELDALLKTAREAVRDSRQQS